MSKFTATVRNFGDTAINCRAEIMGWQNPLLDPVQSTKMAPLKVLSIKHDYWKNREIHEEEVSYEEYFQFPEPSNISHVECEMFETGDESIPNAFLATDRKGEKVVYLVSYWYWKSTVQFRTYCPQLQYFELEFVDDDDLFQVMNCKEYLKEKYSVGRLIGPDGKNISLADHHKVYFVDYREKRIFMPKNPIAVVGVRGVFAKHKEDNCEPVYLRQKYYTDEYDYFNDPLPDDYVDPFITGFLVRDEEGISTIETPENFTIHQLWQFNNNTNAMDSVIAIVEDFMENYGYQDIELSYSISHCMWDWKYGTWKVYINNDRSEENWSDYKGYIKIEWITSSDHYVRFELSTRKAQIRLDRIVIGDDESNTFYPEIIIPTAKKICVPVVVETKQEMMEKELKASRLDDAAPTKLTTLVVWFQEGAYFHHAQVVTNEKFKEILEKEEAVPLFFVKEGKNCYFYDVDNKNSFEPDAVIMKGFKESPGFYSKGYGTVYVPISKRYMVM